MQFLRNPGNFSKQTINFAGLFLSLDINQRIPVPAAGLEPDCPAGDTGSNDKTLILSLLIAINLVIPTQSHKNFKLHP